MKLNKVSMIKKAKLKASRFSFSYAMLACAWIRKINILSSIIREKEVFNCRKEKSLNG